jgi:hypothetical protein
VLGEGERFSMTEGIEAVFPKLRGTNYRVSSPQDDVYNCIAWAAGATDAWWWPVGTGKIHWPDGAPRAETIEAFRDAFATLGYVVCASDELEPDFQKIAVFANGQGVPKHAARQLPDGRWTSKLGKQEDIEHALHDLTGAVYGSVVLIMKRPADGLRGGKNEGTILEGNKD